MDDALISELDVSSYSLEESLLVETMLESVSTLEGQVVTIHVLNVQINCKVCGKVPGCPVKAKEHFVRYHRRVSLLSQCEKCNRSDQNWSILNHSTKCKGVASLVKSDQWK